MHDGPKSACVVVSTCTMAYNSVWFLKSILDAVMHCLLLKKSLSVLLKMVVKFTVLLLMHLKRLIKCYIMDFLLNFTKKRVSIKFVRILQNWCNKLYASVLWNGLLGNIFPILCGVRQGGVLSPLLFSVYVDDLIRELHLSGYGAYVCNLFVETIFYADDICLMSGSCFGLQKLLDICSDYSLKWDILFNPTKSHLFTIGGSNPSASRCI